MDKTLIKAIDAVLSDWAKLDDVEHKGLLYDEAVRSLKQWKGKLEASNV